MLCDVRVDFVITVRERLFFTASGFRIKQGIPVREGREGEGLVVGRRPSLRGRNAPRTGIFFETYILYVGAVVKSLWRFSSSIPPPSRTGA